MSQRIFGNDTYEAVAGWDPPLQYHFLMIYQRGADRNFDEPLFSNLYLPDPAMTLEQIADTLIDYDIARPPTLFADLIEDARLDRGDFDVYYDPETGTASVQAEYGDRPGDDLPDFGVKSPEQAAFDGHVQEVLIPRDFGEEASSPSRASNLVDRIRSWLHRDRDRGMGM